MYQAPQGKRILFESFIEQLKRVINNELHVNRTDPYGEHVLKPCVPMGAY